MTTQSPASMESTDIQSAKLTSTENSASAESNTTRDDDTLAIQSTMSQPNEDAVKAVINTPELLVMMLSHLEIKDLTRAVSVSKHWQQTILGTLELRHNLFLAPKDKPDEFIQWKRVGLEMQPFIVHEPTSTSKPIVKVHPLLFPEPALRSCLDTTQNHNSLKTVSPSTLLTQPPVTEVTIKQQAFIPTYHPVLQHNFVVKRQRGVTFGDVVEEMRARQAREPVSASGDPFGIRRFDIVKIDYDWRYTRIEASGVVAETSKWVVIARENMEPERQGCDGVVSEPSMEDFA